VLSVVAGCAQPLERPAEAPHRVREGGIHVVAAGETLYGIARRYGLDHRDLARWNRLGDGALIYAGQRLRLTAPGAGRTGGVAGAPASAPVDWRWPLEGPVLSRFGATPRTASGILIGARSGETVRAAAAGEVVYSGSGLAGYGQLVIVRHNASWLSAYGHNERLLVTEGTQVRSGDAIALVGEGPGRRPALHFEIRQDGAPVDPLGQLPAR
jgi:lipoprotein NlpD